MNSKPSVKKIFILVAGIFLVGASIRSGNFAVVPLAYAQENCSLATLSGEYLVTGTVPARIEQRDDPTFPASSLRSGPSMERAISPPTPSRILAATTER